MPIRNLQEWGSAGQPGENSFLIRKYAIYENIQPAGTNGGTALSNTNNLRPFNTEQFNNTIGVSFDPILSLFTLLPGKYNIKVISPANSVRFHYIFIGKYISPEEIEILIKGEHYYSSPNLQGQTNAIIDTILDISETITIGIYHIVHTTVNDYGFGKGFTTQENKYNTITITEISPVTSQQEAGALDVSVSHFQDIKDYNVAGGTAINGNWITRELNTIIHNDIIDCSLLNNQITLPVGKYFIEVLAMAANVQSHQIILYDLTAPKVQLRGTTEYRASRNINNENYFISGPSRINGVIELSELTTLEIRHQVSETILTHGFGVPINNDIDNNKNVYTDIIIMKY